MHPSMLRLLACTRRGAARVQIGFSIGARLIFHCLLELSRCGARGIVESVVLLGTPVSINSHRQAAQQQRRNSTNLIKSLRSMTKA